MFPGRSLELLVYHSHREEPLGMTHMVAELPDIFDWNRHHGQSQFPSQQYHHANWSESRTQAQHVLYRYVLRLQ